MSARFSNIIFGTFSGDTLTGGSGRDLVFGLFGDDIISTGAGRDRIFAGWGDDIIKAGAGNDHINGGRGFDTAVYSGSVSDYSIENLNTSGSRVRVTDLAGDEGRDKLVNVEALYFEADDYTLFLDGRNNAVLAGDDAFAVAENGILEITAADLLANDQDFDGDTLEVTTVSFGLNSSGTFSIANGIITFDPGTDFDFLGAGETATETFTYSVTDGNGSTETATVTVTITGENDDPDLVATTDVTVDENTTEVAAGISATDVDSDTITFEITGGADASLFTIDAETGALSFITAPDFEAPADAGGDNVYEVTVTALDGDGGSSSETINFTVADVADTEPSTARINEIHYDDAGADEGEFVEIRLDAGGDISGLLLEFYNGNGGAVYETVSVSMSDFASTDGTFDYYVLNVSGIQNGGPDGIALSDGGALIEFLSYEGDFAGVGGVADGVTSTDIGVFEPNTTPEGFSLQRGEGDTWDDPREETRGASNVVEPQPLVINEL
ncbi:MAG: Ig-like domain-containing protein, partial [Pseudomonadota bacterium]